MKDAAVNAANTASQKVRGTSETVNEDMSEASKEADNVANTASHKVRSAADSMKEDASSAAKETGSY